MAAAVVVIIIIIIIIVVVIPIPSTILWISTRKLARISKRWWRRRRPTSSAITTTRSLCRTIYLSRRVRARLRIAPHIAVRVHALGVALHVIGREEHADVPQIIPRVIVRQPRRGVNELPGIALVRARRALSVTMGAVGIVELLPLHRARAQTHEDGALRVGQIIRRARAICPADQVASDAGGIELARVDIAVVVAELLQPEGIGRQRCGASLYLFTSLVN